jgi:hypothetical protein
MSKTHYCDDNFSVPYAIKLCAAILPTRAYTIVKILLLIHKMMIGCDIGWKDVAGSNYPVKTSFGW